MEPGDGHLPPGVLLEGVETNGASIGDYFAAVQIAWTEPWGRPFVVSLGLWNLPKGGHGGPPLRSYARLQPVGCLCGDAPLYGHAQMRETPSLMSF